MLKLDKKKSSSIRVAIFEPPSSTNTSGVGGMRRSLARNIDGIHDSSSIRRELDDRRDEFDELEELGAEYRDSVDSINENIVALENAQSIDEAERRARIRELVLVREALLREEQEDVERPQDEIIDEMSRLEDSASDASGEHDRILASFREADEHGHADMAATREKLEGEQTALDKLREETAAKADAFRKSLEEQRAYMLREAMRRS
ncbi:MAG: hypothetical protein IKF78_04360 [Atopobiaceae bacterium]|nr:hypothetical protein [Atopobiaceae bacterium]